MNARIISAWDDFTLRPAAPPDVWDGREYRVASGLLWEFRGIAYVIPRDFVTDGASIPRFWRWRLSPWGKWIRAAVVHDWLYRTTRHGLSRKRADMIFREMMRQDGVGWWNRNLMYRAVRLGGWMGWSK